MHKIFSENFSAIQQPFSKHTQIKEKRKNIIQKRTHVHGIFQENSTPHTHKRVTFSSIFRTFSTLTCEKRKTHSQNGCLCPFSWGTCQQPGAFFPTHTKIIINANLRTLEKLFSQRDPLSRKTNKM